MSSTNKGILIPRLTGSQRVGITTPATGLLVYQTDNYYGMQPGFYSYDGTGWVPFGYNASSGGNSYFGLYAGNMAAIQNAGFGYQTLTSNSGNQNTAYGYRALYNNTSGYQNTSIGNNTGYINGSGYRIPC